MGATEIIISLVGGFCAGILNALAGFGSIITLAIYMDVLGIPGHLANATNSTPEYVFVGVFLFACFCQRIAKICNFKRT